MRLGPTHTLLPSRETRFQTTAPLFANFRTYNAAPQLVDELLKRREGIRSLLQKVPGFHTYYLIDTGDGAISMAVCDDPAGAEESNRLAAALIKDKLSTLTTREPEISTGEVRFHLDEPFTKVAV